MIFDKVSDLDVQEIERIKQEYGIEAIILDVDKTLRADMQSIPKVNQDWLESLNGKVKMIILSNGVDKDIEQYQNPRRIQEAFCRTESFLNFPPRSNPLA